MRKQPTSYRNRLKGKKINYKSVIVEGIKRSDFPDFTDAFCIYAEYEDGSKLSDEELDNIDVNSIIHDNQLYL